MTVDTTESEEPDYDRTETMIRAALSPVLGVKPYVIIIDHSTLEDTDDDKTNIQIAYPKYQPQTVVRGLIEFARDIMTEMYHTREED